MLQCKELTYYSILNVKTSGGIIRVEHVVHKRKSGILCNIFIVKVQRKKSLGRPRNRWDIIAISRFSI
jgi:hypothetical protein